MPTMHTAAFIEGLGRHIILQNTSVIARYVIVLVPGYSSGLACLGPTTKRFFLVESL